MFERAFEIYFFLSFVYSITHRVMDGVIMFFGGIVSWKRTHFHVYTVSCVDKFMLKYF